MTATGTTGQLLKDYSIMVAVSIVAGETLVHPTFLMENDEFMPVLKTADSITDVVDWVNENY